MDIRDAIQNPEEKAMTKVAGPATIPRFAKMERVPNGPIFLKMVSVPILFGTLIAAAGELRVKE